MAFFNITNYHQFTRVYFQSLVYDRIFIIETLFHLASRLYTVFFNLTGLPSSVFFAHSCWPPWPLQWSIPDLNFQIAFLYTAFSWCSCQGLSLQNDDNNTYLIKLFSVLNEWIYLKHLEKNMVYYNPYVNTPTTVLFLSTICMLKTLKCIFIHWSSPLNYR